MLLNGSTTDDYVELTDQHSSPDDGLHMYGSIRNAGANDMTFKIVVNDVYGGSDTSEVQIPAGSGNKKSFWSIVQPFGPNTTPPYTDIWLYIKSTNPGQATTYEYHHTQW